MEDKKKDTRLKLSRKLNLRGPDGNIWVIQGFCQDAARRAGWAQEEIDAMFKEAESKATDYDSLVCELNKKFKIL